MTTTRVVHFEFDDEDATKNPIVGRAKILVQSDAVTEAERNAGAGVGYVVVEAEIDRVRLKRSPVLDALPAPPNVKRA